jgi:hypothetical protein
MPWHEHSAKIVAGLWQGGYVVETGKKQDDIRAAAVEGIM